MGKYKEGIRLAGIVKESITDGPGIRFTIFSQGCPHKCKGCHNEETWDINGGQYIENIALLNEIGKNPLISGVTFSGGEPICQAKAFAHLAINLKKENINIALFTGYEYEELIEMADVDINILLQNTDLLIDGKYIEEKRDISLKFRGSSNQRIIDMNKTRESGQLILAKEHML